MYVFRLSSSDENKLIGFVSGVGVSMKFNVNYMAIDALRRFVSVAEREQMTDAQRDSWCDKYISWPIDPDDWYAMMADTMADRSPA